MGSGERGVGSGREKTRATVYLFLASDCPVAGRYGPRLRALSETYAKRGVQFVAVFPNERETSESVGRWLKDRKLSGLTPSRNANLVKKFGATHTPEAILVDAQEKKRYSGRLDNADDPAKVTRKDLSLALDAVLSGRKVAQARTQAFGCLLTPEIRGSGEWGVGSGKTSITAILEKHCVGCHKKGEVGPMPLDDYKTVVGFAQKIKEQAQSKRMPPWKADSSGEFHDEHRLTDAEIQAIATWAKSPAPSVSPSLPSAKVDLPITGAGGNWHLGAPDEVFTMPAYEVPDNGKDIYRCFVIPAGSPDQDRWVKGIEFQPGNRAIVHHASVFIDLSGVGKKLDDDAPGPGYTNPTPGNGPGFNEAYSVLGGWTPGHLPRKLPSGVAIFLPKGAQLVLEVHYHLTGKPEKDQTRFGLHLAKEPIDKRMHLGGVGTQSFSIPPGAKNYLVEATLPTETDITLLSITPHMHERGVRMVAFAELPSGERKKLIDVPRWDFQWQPSYRFKEPVKLPKGTQVTVQGYFNNPTDKPLTWGESTRDEMCVLFSAYTRDDEHLLDEPVIIR